MNVNTQPWLASYDSTVPHQIGDLSHQSLGDMIKDACIGAKDQVAFCCLNTSMTYAEFDRLSDQMAYYFQHQLKLKKGDRMAIMLPNLFQFPMAMFAALKLGLVVTNINPLYTSHELKHQLNDSGAKAIVILDQMVSTLSCIFSQTSLKHVVVARVGDHLPWVKAVLVNGVRRLKYGRCKLDSVNGVMWKSVMESSGGMKPTAVEVVPEDLAFLQYTGGTTGVSKGAMLTHRNLLSNIEQSLLWIDRELEFGKETVVAALPLYHIFSLTICCLSFIKFQSAVLLIPNPRHAKSFVSFLKKTPSSIFVGLNTLFINLLKEKKFHHLNFKSFKMTVSGGMPLQKKVFDQWKDATGMSIIEGYGLTETCPLVSTDDFSRSEFSGSVGLPVPSTQVQVVDEDGQMVAFGEVGEICIKGPQVMKGYWNNPDATSRAIDASGWFHSGDVGYMDEGGYIYMVDRKKDMVIVSGFNVFPNEIEAILSSHPKIDEVAVIGVPCEKTGEALKAFVIGNDVNLRADELIAYCQEKLTSYKVPKQYEFVETLPKSPIGKVLRRSLR